MYARTCTLICFPYRLVMSILCVHKNYFLQCVSLAVSVSIIFWIICVHFVLLYNPCWIMAGSVRADFYMHISIMLVFEEICSMLVLFPMLGYFYAIWMIILQFEFWVLYTNALEAQFFFSYLILYLSIKTSQHPCAFLRSNEVAGSFTFWRPRQDAPLRPYINFELASRAISSSASPRKSLSSLRAFSTSYKYWVPQLIAVEVEYGSWSCTEQEQFGEIVPCPFEEWWQFRFAHIFLYLSWIILWVKILLRALPYVILLVL